MGKNEIHLSRLHKPVPQVSLSEECVTPLHGSLNTQQTANFLLCVGFQLPHLLLNGKKSVYYILDTLLH